MHNKDVIFPFISVLLSCCYFKILDCAVAYSEVIPSEYLAGLACGSIMLDKALMTQDLRLR